MHSPPCSRHKPGAVAVVWRELMPGESSAGASSWGPEWAPLWLQPNLLPASLHVTCYDNLSLKAHPFCPSVIRDTQIRKELNITALQENIVKST